MEDKALSTVVAEHGLERANSLFFDVARFNHAKNVGEMLAKSTMVPEQFRNNMGNCIIALNLADRVGVDVFMMMQSMYIVHGRPGIEGKLVIALIEASGRFSPLEYEVKESQKKTIKNVLRPDSCIAFATDLKTGRIIRGPAVTWEMVEAEGWNKDKGAGNPSKWVTLPDLMFRYRAATLFGRVHCPGALLGLQTREEIEDIEMVQVAPGSYRTVSEDPEPTQTVDSPVEVIDPEKVKAFDEALPEDIDPAMMKKFLDTAASYYNKSVDAFKTEGSSDMPSLLKQFNKWLEKQEAEKKKAEAAERFDCPDGGFVTLAVCEECKKREDAQGVICPAFSAAKK